MATRYAYRNGRNRMKGLRSDMPIRLGWCATGATTKREQRWAGRASGLDWFAKHDDCVVLGVVVVAGARSGDIQVLHARTYFGLSQAAANVCDIRGCQTLGLHNVVGIGHPPATKQMHWRLICASAHPDGLDAMWTLTVGWGIGIAAPGHRQWQGNQSTAGWC